MQLTLYTDYSLRVLIYLAERPEPTTITQMSDFYGISRNHLVKVVHNLGKLGYIHTKRGRVGGITLGKPAEDINIGEVVRKTEPHFHLVECFDVVNNTCPIIGTCGLKSIFHQANQSFMKELDRYNLSDLVKKPVKA